ncbi:MAG: hypothetical protein HY426_02855 [Candidatus Levybacteria bacterium]|nr:hypothetical protein [Candidatus Levybacteria bacterium]
MDPKLSGLDPKLKEAYDRVMSGPAPAPGQTPAAGGAPMGAVPPPPTQQVSPPPPAPTPSFGATPVQSVTPAEPAPSVAPNPSAGGTIAFNANNAGKNQGTTAIKHGGSKLMPVFMGLGIVVFLLAYTFVWVYVFKLQIPFLP